MMQVLTGTSFDDLCEKIRDKTSSPLENAEVMAAVDLSKLTANIVFLPKCSIMGGNRIAAKQGEICNQQAVRRKKRNDKLVKRVFELISKMENNPECKVLNVSAENIISSTCVCNGKPYTRKTWNGSPFMKYVPTNKEWSCVELREAVVEDVFLVSRVIWNGSHPCRHQDPNDKRYFGYIYGNQDVVVQRLDTGAIGVYSSLTLHMIQEHNDFNEGIYIQDPEKMREVLFVSK